MYREYFSKLFSDHRGKVIGVSLGLIIGIFVLLIGFWKTLFLLLCMGIGYWIGGISDKKGRFVAFLDRILPKGFDDR